MTTPEPTSVEAMDDSESKKDEVDAEKKTVEDEDEEDENDSNELADKVKNMFSKPVGSGLAMPDSLAEAFHGSGSVHYSPGKGSSADEEDAQNGTSGDDGDNTDKDADPEAPGSPTTQSAVSRADAHKKLRAYEASRRASYQTKLTSSSIYWRSVRELCHEAVAETARAESMFRGYATINDAYGSFLKASGEDQLDEKGRPVEAKKGKKNISDLLSLSSSMSKGSVDKEDGHDKKDAKAECEGKDKDTDATGRPPEAAFGKQKEEKIDGGMLDSLFQSHCAMSEDFSQFACFIEKEAVPETNKIIESFRMLLELMELVGDSLIAHMEAAEEDVREAWKNYYNAAEPTLRTDYNKIKLRGVQMTVESNTSEEDAKYVEDCKDVWILEMKYRMKVAFLAACWEQSSSEMSKVFTALKREECSRRFRLREVLSTFLEKQDNLWLSLPLISAPLLKNLSGKAREPADIEDEVQNVIRARAFAKQQEAEEEERRIAEMKEEEDDDDEKEEEKETSDLGLSGVDPAIGAFDLQSPLLSDLLVKADLIEVKYSPYLMKPWKTVLAIVTANSFLHLFDVPSTRYSDANEAFGALVPKVEVPTEETAKTMNSARHRKDWYKPLQAYDSFALANTTVAFLANTTDAFSFEIAEKVNNNAATSVVMGKTTTRKMILRVLSKEQEKEWIAAMKMDKFDN